MSENTQKGTGFVGYEYKEVTVSRELETIYADNYRNFGWELENTSIPLSSITSVCMKFKCDRKLRSKAEITRLQRQFDSLAKEIMSLEQSKTIGAATIAYVIGIVGTACMAGSVFAYLEDMLPLCIILAVPAFIGWVIPYFCFLRISRRRAEKLEPIIDQKYDEIYEVCEKASSMLAD